MTIGTGTTLNAGLGATLDLAYCPGDISSPGNIREMVSNTEQAMTLTSATQGSDLDGDAVISGGASAYASVAATFDPAGGQFSAVIVFKPSTLTTSAWVGLFSLASGTDIMCQLGRNDNTNNLWQSHKSGAGDSPFIDAVGLLAINTLVTLVFTWDGTNTKLFATSQSPISDISTEPQGSGAATFLRFFNTAGLDGAWPGRIYFVGYSNDLWSDSDAQAIADDVETELFGAGGGTLARIVNGGLTGSPLVHGSLVR